MSLLQNALKKDQLLIPKRICSCLYQTYVGYDVAHKNGKIPNIPFVSGGWFLNNTRLLLWQQQRFAGHSKWQNIKFIKMHKDNARAKVFGRLSLEIIEAVREKGPDPTFNSKLEGLISKAKSNNMTKNTIETSIKKALRVGSDEKLNRLLLQVHGPGRCGLLIEVLTPNIARSKGEIKRILKRTGATFIEDGSIAFMFIHKGVVTVEAAAATGEMSEDEKAEAEEIAIMIGAEEIRFDVHEDGRNVYQFICQPLEIHKLQKSLNTEYQHLKLLSADAQYLAKTLTLLSDTLMDNADRLIDMLTDHHDVVNVFDNIIDYPSKTIKLSTDYG